jgi:DNA-binding MarR family transcriptional regulator
MAPQRKLTDRDYHRLLDLRVELRRFLRWSNDRVAAAGLTPNQHQLLLAVRGHVGPDDPTIGDIASYLFVRHHSAVGLVDRAAEAKLVRRVRDRDDHRVVRVLLTAKGARKLESLAAEHLEELDRVGLALGQVSEGLAEEATAGA